MDGLLAQTCAASTHLMDGDNDVAVFQSDSGSTLELLVDFELATVR